MAITPKGQRGGWTAKVKGYGDVPVYHEVFVVWPTKANGKSVATYEQGGVNRWPDGTDYATSGRWAKQAALADEKKVVLIQRNKRDERGKPTSARDGYRGLFVVYDVKFEGGVVTFDIVREIPLWKMA